MTVLRQMTMPTGTKVLRRRCWRRCQRARKLNLMKVPSPIIEEVVLQRGFTPAIEAGAHAMCWGLLHLGPHLWSSHDFGSSWDSHM